MSSKKKTKFPPRYPRFAAGLRFQLRPSDEAMRSWWWREWLMAISVMSAGPRLEKGRKYALSGQVVSLKIDGSHVDADVVGTRSGAYRVTLDFRAPPAAARRRIAAAIRSEPMNVARLLAGDMPIEVASLFRDEGFSLFPGGKLSAGGYDMTCSCNCPDWANPCKHVFAVLFILGEEIALNPLRLLELRGIKTEDVCGK